MILAATGTHCDPCILTINHIKNDGGDDDDIIHKKLPKMLSLLVKEHLLCTIKHSQAREHS